MSWDIGGPQKRDFSCLYCETTLPKVIPPDDIHIVASRIYYEIPVGVCLAATFVCANPKCEKENTIYWYTQQAFRQSLKSVPRTTIRQDESTATGFQVVRCYLVYGSGQSSWLTHPSDRNLPAQ